MSHLNTLKNKIFTLEELKTQVESWKNSGEKVVFTNGCFDIVHRGHIEVLARTADLGSKFIIGLNSDSSIKKLKGDDRPIINEQSRAILLASLSFVDAVVLFSEETPINLISTLVPDVLAKGGDYEIKTIVGHEIVQKNGGKVILVPFVDGFSSTNIIDKIKNS
ncbi:D-glycero-beta-D-manno-heptose 1-phosphate adenylyltransferase [Flavobacteriales bacterium]|jgi:rfaE bifunctional protein nucleotidyltransferase chain/domain|nr:D-glycero-beta-D-manno-heptose 1-phosphate adenylyltransferase [Flavobacteriales bacterium]MDC3305879.1 D-glycero-beta-D-manno-heptose 1-phosphate adenylyltransferase [Flavobacteriales bacterium]MDG1348097.1 D-glycero-beta-D-manno-heptose 1-phosphate adenylyltransferase [Flavobacteriales bacterium]|tara:strand:- start:4705 stop:5196 length:492 start_codon:yes stop_codon:yes gene_type:complete